MSSATYTLLNNFASQYLDGGDKTIITGDKIITNGNCFFHAIGYAYFTSTRNSTDNDNKFAVKKISNIGDPSYNIELTTPTRQQMIDKEYINHHLFINNYNPLFRIEQLKDFTRDEQYNLDTITLATSLKNFIAHTIRLFNQAYNTGNPTKEQINIDEVSYYSEFKNDTLTKVNKEVYTQLNINEFISPIPGKLSYYPAEDTSIYAAAFLLNKIICIISCHIDLKTRVYNIVNYRIFGPKNMVCTDENILFLLHEGFGHYETFYPESKFLNGGQQLIKCKTDGDLNIAKIFNMLITQIKEGPIINAGIIPKQFIDHFEYYEIASDKIPITPLKPPVNKTPPAVPNEDLATDTAYISNINRDETNQDTLFEIQTLYIKLTEEQTQLELLIPALSVPTEVSEANTRSSTIKSLITGITTKIPIEKLFVDVPHSNLPIDPTSSINPNPSPNKASVPIKYSFYSKERPVLNLAEIISIQYTPYILRDRTRTTLTLNALTE